MIRKIATGLAIAALMGGAAMAETFEVKMLNKGEDGARMVFEPAFIQAQPGDTVVFLASDKGHNAETVKGMIPEGAEGLLSTASFVVADTFVFGVTVHGRRVGVA